MMKMLAGMLAVAVAVGMGGPVARAQSARPAPAPVAKPTKAQLAKAKAHYDLGEAYKKLEKYKQAEAEYLESYRLSGRPFLKFNAGLMLWLAGDKDGAVAHFRDYIAKDPNGDPAAVAKAKACIEEVEAAARAVVEAKRAVVEAARKAKDDAERERRQAAKAKAAKAAQEMRQSAEAEVRRRNAAAEVRRRNARVEAKRRAAAELVRDAQLPEEIAPRRPGRVLRIGGMVAAGGGVAAIVAGGVFGNKVRGGIPMARDAQDRAAYRAAYRNMVIGYSVGAAAVVTGGVLYYLGARAGREGAAGVAVSPIADGQTMGMAVGGRF